MGLEYRKWIQCNALFIDDQLESMGVEQEVWERMCIDLSMVLAFSEGSKLDGMSTQVYLPGIEGVVVDIPYDKFKEILTE